MPVPVQDVEMHSAQEKKEQTVEVYQAPEKDVPVTGEKFIEGLALVLEIWVQEAAKKGGTEGKPKKVSEFHSSAKPNISIYKYLERLRKYFGCSDECFVHALVYIDRIGTKNESMLVGELTVHRLLSTATMLAAKFHDDVFYANHYYGRASGMSLKEVNKLEVTMLKALEWKARVTVEEYELYHNLVYQAMGASPA